MAARRALWLWLGLLWAGANLARAQAESDFLLQLRAPAGAGCSDGAALTSQVEARTGRKAHASAAAVSVDVQIEATPQGYRAVVSLLGSLRELQTLGACSELDEMLVVVIASSLGVGAAPRKEPVQEKVAWQVALPRSAAAPDTTHAPAEHAPSPPLQLDVAAAARMLTGILPRPAFGAGLAWLAQWAALGVRIATTYLPSASYSVRPALALEVTGGWAELGLCGRAAHGTRLSALFCADVQAGALRASAAPLWHAAARWDPLLMVVPRAEGRLQLAPVWGVAVSLGAAIPLVFPRYAYATAAGEQVSAHTPELGLFVELALWLRILP